MPVTIDQIEIESAPEPAPQSTRPSEEPPPDVHELERALRLRRERLDRVRAH